MHRKTLFTLAALSATCLLPMTGAFAQDTTSTSVSIQDPAQFREDLYRVRELFKQIRENHTLSLAAQDRMVASTFERTNTRLMNQALGILDTISKNWEQTEITALPGKTAEMRSARSIDRFGSANAVRFASESDDTAFVRNTVWDLRNELHADKLNGRPALVSDEMMTKLEAAIARAENPNFRVAWHEMNRERLARRIELSEGIDLNIPPASETTTEVTREEVIETPAPTEETTETVERTETIETTPTEETTTVETFEESTAPLPQTGGDPGMLVLLGSGLAGLGALVRRRR